MAPPKGTEVSFINAAMDLARRGWPPFPVCWPRNGSCGCGWKHTGRNVGKAPRLSNGFKGASIDPKVIAGWGQDMPHANVGFATGKGSGVLVLDQDPRNGGVDSLARLEDRYGRLPETPQVLTGGGGAHYYFKNPTGVDIPSGKLEGYPGLDVKGSGGYVVAPGSVHVSGKTYEWEASSHPDDVPLALAPQWLVDLILTPTPSAPIYEVLPTPGVPLGRAALHFVANGAPVGSQRGKALAATRNYLSAGYSPEATFEAIKRGIAASPQDMDDPWTDEEIWKLVNSISTSPAPPLKPFSQGKVYNGARADAGDDVGDEHEGDGVHEHEGGAVKALKAPLGPAARPWPEPLAEAAYHGVVGELVKAIEPHTESDPASLLLTILVAAGNAIGRIPHARVEGTRHYFNLFVGIVGETSKSRKGTSWGRVRQPFVLVNTDWTERVQMGGLSSGEGLIWAVRDAIVKERRDKDGTATAETIDEGIRDKRLLVVETEFAGVLKAMARQGNSLSPILRQAWDMGNLRSIVKDSPARATEAHISLIGHITKQELLTTLSEMETGNGFANRFLWACSKRARVLPSGGGEVDYSALAPKLFEALRGARTIGLVTRDDETEKAWAAIYPELSADRAGLLGDVTARAEAQVLRLAGLYAVLDGASVVQLKHLKAGLAVWDYCEASAKYIFGDALGDPIADRILEVLRANTEGVSRTDLSNYFGRHVSSARLGTAFDLLFQNKRATMRFEQTEGRSREVWTAL